MRVKQAIFMRVKQNTAKSILKKSRHIGFVVFIVNSSMVSTFLYVLFVVEATPVNASIKTICQFPILDSLRILPSSSM
jgi:hypothetical protein